MSKRGWRSSSGVSGGGAMCLAVLRQRLRLVESLQRAVVTLVQPPGALHRYPHALHLIEHDPERADRALEHRSEGDVDRQMLAHQLAAGLGCLAAAELGQLDVGPAGEQVLHVPQALAMAHQNELARRAAVFTVHVRCP
jgi:hypothetical protein